MGRGSGITSGLRAFAASHGYSLTDVRKKSSSYFAMIRGTKPRTKNDRMWATSPADIRYLIQNAIDFRSGRQPKP